MIPYVRTVNYLSASALRMLEQNPVEFYFRRLGPPECAPPREQQSFPAAVGTAFDAFVKQAVAKECALACPSQEFMLREVTEQRDRAIAMGAQLLYGYQKSGAYKRLVEERPSSVTHDFEDFVPGTQVPIRSKIDCMIEHAGRVVPHDWKVTGANRPGQVSPTPGYCRQWDSDQPGLPKAAHEKWQLNFEELDEDWATQLSIYSWAMGTPVTEVYASIDEVIVGADGRVRVAQFRNRISEGFQRKLVARLEDAWRRIKEEKVVPDHIARMSLADAKVLM